MMMKAFVIFLIIAALSYIAALYYPWWSLAVVAFAVTLVVPQKPFAAFVTAFAAIFILWFSMAFFIDLSNDHILGKRIAVLFLHTPAPLLMAVICGVVGGVVAGFAALSASCLRTRKKSPAASSYKDI